MFALLIFFKGREMGLEMIIFDLVVAETYNNPSTALGGVSGDQSQLSEGGGLEKLGKRLGQRWQSKLQTNFSTHKSQHDLLDGRVCVCSAG